MPTITAKDAIARLGDLTAHTHLPLIQLLQPWMVITGLEFKDAVHLTHFSLLQKLVHVHSKLGDSLDILDEDQLREAACRCFKRITVYGDFIGDGDIVLRHGQDIDWDGSTWNFISDPKLRMRETSKLYVDALAAVKERTGI